MRTVVKLSCTKRGSSPFHLAPLSGVRVWRIIPLMIPKDAKLMGLHQFYKNDLPEGFGVGLDEQFFIDDPKVEQIFCDASQMSINEFKKRKTDKEREQFIAGIQEQFAQCCQWMNQHKGQPMDEEWVSCFVILLDDMTFLQSLDLQRFASE